MYRNIIYGTVIFSAIYGNFLQSSNFAQKEAYKPLLRAGAFVAPQSFEQGNSHDKKVECWIMARDGAFWASVVSASAAYATALFTRSSCKVPVRWIGLSVFASIVSCIAHNKLEQLAKEDA